MAGPHALTGVCAGLELARLTHADPPTAVALAVAGAGASLLPDIDHHGSTATRALGPLSRLAHAGVSELGPHRGPTHWASAALLGSGLAWLLLLHPWGVGALIVALLVPVALVADDLIPGPHWTAAGAILAVGVGVGAAGPAGVAALGVDLAWVPVAVGLGWLAHIAGDQVTHSGVQWLPWTPVVRLPVSIRAGGPVERWLVTPVLVVRAGWLGWLALV